MIRTFCMTAVLFALAVSVAMAGGTLTHRVDGAKGTHALHTYVLSSDTWLPDIDLLGEPDIAAFEIGKAVPVVGSVKSDNQVAVGCWLSRWPKINGTFIDPYVSARARIGKLHLNGDLGAYYALDSSDLGRPSSYFSNDLAARYAIAKNVKLGVSGNFWWMYGMPYPTTETFKWGPSAQLNVDRYELTARWATWGSGPMGFQLQSAVKF